MAEATKTLDAVLGDYLVSTRSATEWALNSLNASVNWALSLTLAVLALVGQLLLGGNDTSAHKMVFSLFFVGAAIGMLVHFGIRTIKSYINVIRFATLERVCLTHLLAADPDLAAPLPSALVPARALPRIIETYHLLWKSPIPISLMVRKLFFEFGFLYNASAVTALFLYIAVRVFGTHPWAVIGILSLLAVSVLAEILSFRASAYGRSITIDSLAQSLG